MSAYAPVDLEQIAKDTAAKMTHVAQQAYAPVMVRECGLCWRGYKDNGDKCFNCAGLGRIATDGGEV